MEQVRVGVIGCGIGAFHVEGFKEDPRARVVALAGLDEERCSMLTTKHEIPHRYRNYEEMLANPDIDAVTVAVPNFLHGEVTLAAIAAGKHVMIEKPMCKTVEEGEQIVAAARASGKVVGMFFNRRTRSDIEYIQRLASQGYFGDIYYCKAYWLRRSGVPGLGTWFTQQAMSGGGPLIDLGVHMMDAALWAMGNPTLKTVSAQTWAKLGPQGKGQWPGSRFKAAPNAIYDVEDLASAFMRFTNGAAMQLEVSWAAYLKESDEFGFEIMGDKAGARVHIKDYAKVGDVKLFTDLAGEAVVITPPLMVGREGHAGVASNFLDAIIDGKPMSPSVEEGLDRVRVIDAIYRSAAAGREIELG
jgi:predicted dehydrogenase